MESLKVWKKVDMRVEYMLIVRRRFIEGLIREKNVCLTFWWIKNQLYILYLRLDFIILLLATIYLCNPSITSFIFAFIFSNFS